MENKFYTDDFELLLKEKSDEFRMYPSKRVWHSVYNDLHPSRKWPSVAISMLLITTLLMMGYWNSNNKYKTIIAATKNNQSLQLASNTVTNSDITKQLPLFNLPITSGTSATLLPNFTTNNLQQPLTIPVTAKTNNSLVLNNKADKKIFSNHSSAQNSNSSVYQQKLSYSKSTKKYNSQTDNKNNLNVDVDKSATTTVAAITLINITNAQADDHELKDGQIKNGGTSIEAKQVLQEDNKNNNIASLNQKTISKVVAVSKNNTLTTDERAWIDDYAFHNKSKRKKWKDLTALEFYITPGVQYRNFSSNSKFNAAATNNTPSPLAVANFNESVNQKPGLGLEAGIGIAYSFAKNFKLKIGAQSNYTSYVINADETNHPISTTLMFNDLAGYPYMESRVSVLSNSTSLNPTKVHSQTYQVSIPVGLAVKLLGSKKLEWYAAVAIQPTYVFGGKAKLLSADKRNYVSDPSLIKRWNLNGGVETYVQYKLGRYAIQAGPQFRYQLSSTYAKKYTLNENLYNAGIKVGIVKNL